MKKSLFLFHRDLRLYDNTGLIQALKNSQKVIPAFILDPAQIENNPYRGDHALQFMFSSLRDLDVQLKERDARLLLFYGPTLQIIKHLIQKEGIEAIFTNADYTPFAQKRDQELEIFCKEKKIHFSLSHDTLLHAPGQIMKADGTPYTIYTPYARVAYEHSVPNIQDNPYSHYFSDSLSGSKDISFLNTLIPTPNPLLALKGGREEGLKLLAQLSKQRKYKEERDFPFLNSTSHLSAHHKFGTVSIRETYHHILKSFSLHHPFIGELFWRDFFTQIAFHFPHVFQGAFRKKYNTVPWVDNEQFFRAWCEGRTGFPIVDAGMRELNQTGFMHNRVRMITASFLVKNLHIDWRKGERYFAQKLVDYDPAVNNGNWQWAASTGCDAQPYFRIFNPWRQQERFDPECFYIKRWVPELNSLSPKQIHRWDQAQSLLVNYPSSIVNHSQTAKEAKELFILVKN